MFALHPERLDLPTLRRLWQGVPARLDDASIHRVAAAASVERIVASALGTGIMRHADVGYEEAIACAKEQGLDLPML